jgi:hypothetical protein
MEPITAPDTEPVQKTDVDLFWSVMGKLFLTLLVIFLVLAGINATHDPAMNYTGGGTVKMSVPFGSVSCMITVTQDNGVEHVYDKIAAPHCVGFHAGSRVHVTRGMVD